MERRIMQEVKELRNGGINLEMEVKV